MSGMASLEENDHIPSESIEPVSLPEVVQLQAKSVDSCSVNEDKIVEDQWLKHHSSGRRCITRAYQVWPGNNVFFFRGRLICGPDSRGLLLTVLSIGLSCWISTVYVVQDSPNHSGLISTVVAVILTLIVLVQLMVVSMIDPGIIPRNDHSPFEEDVGTTDRTKRKSITTVNGIEIKLKYCRICKIYRPPRCCHYTICDNCVEKFDHHCPWIGQCVGLRNYRFYLAFLLTALAFFIYIFSLCSWRIHQRVFQAGTGLLGLLQQCPETAALASFTFAAIAFLGSLVSYNVYLIAINQTFYENFRQRHAGSQSQNPYDKGILGNMKEVFFVPLPPSRVDFRAEITPERGRSWAS